jgi:hypothetical protein
MSPFRTTKRRDFLTLAGLGGATALTNSLDSMTHVFADEPVLPEIDRFQFSAKPMLQLSLDRSLAVRG